MNNLFWHILAGITACVWGSTFAASSILISAGLTPAEIMCLRFIIAYILLLPFCHTHLRPRSWRDEIWFALLGMTGGSVYFLCENYAIALTSYTSTVSLIVCTCPIWTALIIRMIWPSEKLTARFLLGSVVTASNYLYFNPVMSLWVGALLLGEAVTWPALVGCAITIFGVWLCNRPR